MFENQLKIKSSEEQIDNFIYFQQFYVFLEKKMGENEFRYLEGEIFFQGFVWNYSVFSCWLCG